jgi:cytoskeletal protein CcmA (bactofilin family)
MRSADLRYSIGTIYLFGHLQFTRTMGATPGVPERIRADFKETPMFKKTQAEEKQAPTPTQHAAADPVMVRTRSVSVIGPTLVFKGELSADEDLVIQGTIEGTIAHHKKNLTVGKEGRVKADINAASVTIEGHVEGDIHGDDFVELAKSAVVTGNIFCGRIKMADGATFNGSIEMGAPRPAQAKLSVADDRARDASRDPARTHNLGA